MTEKLKASDLNRTHIGRIVRVKIDKGAECTDHLCGVSHSGDTTSLYFGNGGTPSYRIGPVSTVLTFVRLGNVSVNGTDDVELSDVYLS